MVKINDDLTNVLIRRQTYIERLKAERVNKFVDAHSAMRSFVRRLLNDLGVDRLSDLPRRQLNAVVNQITKQYQTIQDEYEKQFNEWLLLFLALEIRHTTQSVNDTLGTQLAPPVADSTMDKIKPVIIGALGGALAESLAAWGSQATSLYVKRLRQAYANKWTIAETVRDIIGTKARNFLDGAQVGVDRLAKSTITTIVQHVSSVGRVATLQKFSKYIEGYEWVSVLDSKTSATCRSLDGKRFKFGEGPTPPAHPNCRSHIEPVFFEKTTFKTGTERRTPSGQTYYEWLKKQPKAFIDDVLGPTRSKLFRSGGISASEFAKLNVTRTFQPMTLDEMRKKAPQIFANAGV